MEPDARESTVPQLRRQGRWLVDRQGRVVLIHGLNLVWKHAPYAPPATAAGFTWRDARWLKRHGFNAARLGTLWAGLTPDRPDQLDPSYLAKWQRVMDLLAGQQIWMQLDFHQDQWHETYGGEGVPDWAVHRPDPFALLPPVNAPFPMGYWTPELSTVFDNFWADQDHLLSDWATAWQLTARHWRGQPYSMGYDLLNEPWAGLEWATCLLDSCPSTYANELQPAFEKALAAIRTVDPGNVVWFEPQQLAAGQPLDTFLTSVAGERNLGLSWHNYCPDIFLQSQGLPPSPIADVENCVEYSNGRNDHALGQARTMHAVPLMSEYGATDNLRAIEIDADAADQHLMGWMDWGLQALRRSDVGGCREPEPVHRRCGPLHGQMRQAAPPGAHLSAGDCRRAPVTALRPFERRLPLCLSARPADLGTDRRLRQPAALSRWLHGRGAPRTCRLPARPPALDPSRRHGFGDGRDRAALTRTVRVHLGLEC
jgi:endoglycosylceramidase